MIKISYNSVVFCMAISNLYPFFYWWTCSKLVNLHAPKTFDDDANNKMKILLWVSLEIIKIECQNSIPIIVLPNVPAPGNIFIVIISIWICVLNFYQRLKDLLASRGWIGGIVKYDKKLLFVHCPQPSPQFSYKFSLRQYTLDPIISLSLVPLASKQFEHNK